jgi:peptidyl-prolyl cis-trans isomerase B (cyclophilin B)
VIPALLIGTLVSAAVAALALAGCGGGGGSKAEANGCEDAEQPETRASEGEKPPTAPLDGRKTYRITVETNCGAFTITLDPAASPRAAASFVALAENGYFDDTAFHRIVPCFVIQGGDPTGTGSGGPAYTTVDRPEGDTRYTKGVVAMAKTAAEPPGTAGSQFFVVTAADAQLPPDYAVIGSVTEGLDVVERIGTLGNPTTERPRQTVVIDEMAVDVS